ncbi:MAG: ABC transporter permease [Fretibacterium sp.]|nr:ABC transporter permease [Fretibacterium sp.]
MSAVIWNLLFKSFGETLYMIGLSGLLACLGGIPLGVLLYATVPGGLMPRPWLNRIVGFVVNAARSTPFIILMVALLPFTRFVVGRSIGTTAAIVPLAFAALPFMSRLVESALKEVEPGVIEAAQAMGASPWQIVCKVLFPESVPGLLRGVTLMLVNLVGYSAMAGVVGGGGLGDVAIRFGHQRFRPDVMVVTVVIMIAMVQVIQGTGDALARCVQRRRGLED